MSDGTSTCVRHVLNEQWQVPRMPRKPFSTHGQSMWPGGQLASPPPHPNTHTHTTIMIEKGTKKIGPRSPSEFPAMAPCPPDPDEKEARNYSPTSVNK